MPRVYLTKCDERKNKIIKFFMAASAGKQAELSGVWGISQPAVSYKIKHGNLTLLDLYNAREVIKLDARDVAYLIGGE